MNVSHVCLSIMSHIYLGTARGCSHVRVFARSRVFSFCFICIVRSGGSTPHHLRPTQPTQRVPVVRRWLSTHPSAKSQKGMAKETAPHSRRRLGKGRN